MNHSSTNAGSTLGNFLALSPKPPIPKSLASSETHGVQNKASFNDAYKGARQEAADYRTPTKPIANRPEQTRPEAPVRTAGSARPERESRPIKNEQVSEHTRDHVSEARKNTASNQHELQHNQSQEAQVVNAETGDHVKIVEDASVTAVELETINSDINSEIEAPLEIDTTNLDVIDVGMSGSSIQENVESITSELVLSPDIVAITADTLPTEQSATPQVEQITADVSAAELTIDSELAAAAATTSQLPSGTPTESATLVDAQAAVVSGQLGLAPSLSNSSGSPTVSFAAISDIDSDTIITTEIDFAESMSESEVKLNTDKLGSKAAVIGEVGNKLDTLGQDKALAVTSQKESIAKLLANQPETRPLGQSTSSTPTQTAAAVESFARTMETLSPTGRGFVAQSSVATSVGHPQWSQAVGDRVLWLAAQNITSAELRLDPPELGPMQVRVSVNQEQVQVSFSSPHAIVREALDQGATRLREMFNEQGLTVSVDVSDREARERGEGESAKGRRGGKGEVAPEENLLSEVAVTHLRLIDHYA